MLFHEIYGCYYNAVAKILSEAVQNHLTYDKMKSIVTEKAFSESVLTIIPSLENEKWQLLDKDLKTPLRHEPTMPLTTLQKRWLKAICLDPRIQLFGEWEDFLMDVEPLFTVDDYVVFDKYNDGDPFEDKNYINIFHTILQAIHHRKRVTVAYNGKKSGYKTFTCDPYKLEYSEKDDKFRVLVSSCRFGSTLNVANIMKCQMTGDAYLLKANREKRPKQYFIMEVIDERNALERVMLHFAHFEKSAERISEHQYRVKVYYEGDDETELVIRVLSFGPFVKVTEPPKAVELIKDRLKMQKSCGRK